MRSLFRKPTRKVVAALSAAALALTAVVTPMPAQAQDKTPKEILRADATGECEWSPTAYWWVQDCDVYSPSMGRNIRVQIQAAANGGDSALYVLDGGRAPDTHSEWISDGGIQEYFWNDDVTLVAPAGGAGSFHADWLDYGRAGDEMTNFKWETFLTQELPEYLEREFGVSRNRNAVAGISMAASGAINLAARHPDQFVQASSFSGYLTLSGPIAYAGVAFVLRELGDLNINSLYGEMYTERQTELDPFSNIPKLAGKDVYISAATGVWGPNEVNVPLYNRVVGSALEFVAFRTSTAWETEARAQGVNVTTSFPFLGTHNWALWKGEMANARPAILSSLGV